MGIFNKIRGGSYSEYPPKKTQFNTGGMARPTPPQPPARSNMMGAPSQLDAQGKLGSGGKPAMTTAQVDARLSEMNKDWGMKNGYAKPYDVSGR
jgi:hypothetical protein